MDSPLNTNDAEDKSQFLSNLNVFRQIEFFSGVPIEVVKLFAFLSKRHSYKAGDVIFHQDNDDENSYYILSGKAKLVVKKEGKEYVINEYNKESYFGVLSLMTAMPKLFSLVATEDTTCLVMSRNAFSKIVHQFPDLPLKIIGRIGQRVLQAEKKCLAELELNDNVKFFLGISLI